MQSSYNLFKGAQVQTGTSKQITTVFVANTHKKEAEKREEQSVEVIEEVNIDRSLEEAKAYMNSCKEIGNSILQEAKRKKEQIVMEALEKAEAMEREGYEKGYSQGLENGYSDGLQEAEKKTKEQASEIINEAESVLKKANDDYNNYLSEKEDDIVKLSFTIAEQILKEKLTVSDGINKIVEDAIADSKGEENIIIRCNAQHIASINENIKMWETTYNIKGQIFLLVDVNMQPGNAIIEKKTGKTQVGIDVGLKMMEKAIFG